MNDLTWGNDKFLLLEEDLTDILVRHSVGSYDYVYNTLKNIAYDIPDDFPNSLADYFIVLVKDQDVWNIWVNNPQNRSYFQKCLDEGTIIIIDRGTKHSLFPD